MFINEVSLPTPMKIYLVPVNNEYKLHASENKKTWKAESPLLMKTCYQGPPWHVCINDDWFPGRFTTTRYEQARQFADKLYPPDQYREHMAFITASGMNNVTSQEFLKLINRYRY